MTLPATNDNGVRLFNYTGIDDVVKRLIAMTDGERATVARNLTQHDPKLADKLADLLIDSVYDALREKKPVE